MNKNIIFISSLSHSGSTLLDLIISCHSNFVGLGEVCSVFNSLKSDKILCSCGKLQDECVFWSAFNKNYNDQLSIEDKYKLLYKTFYEIHSNEIIPVDSSKDIKSLKYYIKNDFSIKVLRIVKDVRPYTISQIKNAKRKGKNFKNKLALYHFLNWYKKNKEFDEFSYKQNLDVKSISYDGLCLNPEKVIQKICSFLEVEYEPTMAELSKSKSHIIRGNRMRSQPGKNRRIIYDNRWFHNNKWLIPFMFLRKVRNYNNTILLNDDEKIFDI